MNAPQTQFGALLIANRGEIARRVMRTARAMGVRTIAVYSDADADAPHVRDADAAVRIGPAPAGESYLNIDAIIDAARASGADAVHPGYGFLSENAEFARACADAGLIFVGPDPDAIDLMGDKAKAKRRMIEAGVPCVPGYQGDDQSDETLAAEARKIGLPVMVKAAAGGGGRGMRLVSEEARLKDAIKDARSEAVNAFGAGELIIEKAVVEPRHVEIQVFADRHGAVIHLGERDCSVQRRHQKVLEEAPCPVMTPDLRNAMGEAAVKAARDIGYVGAGTVEFLLDANGKFYFLEMNTRLQVEHPVTELVTGLDLVALQLQVAAGAPLPLGQDDVLMQGHAIEARLYAEDPAAGFLPASGDVEHWIEAGGDGVRIDSGVESGARVSPFYDPMIAKVIAHGATRDEARRRLIKALKETAAFGVVTNRSFLVDALGQDLFARGEATTGFIAAAYPDGAFSYAPCPANVAAACALLHEARRRDSEQCAVYAAPALANWASATRMAHRYGLEIGAASFDATLTPLSPGVVTVDVGGEKFEIAINAITRETSNLAIDGRRTDILFHLPETAPALSRIFISVDGRDYDIVDTLSAFAAGGLGDGAGAITAPMHGMLIELTVAPGDAVERGARVGVLEAMKMQHELVAKAAGVVRAVRRKPGEQVAANEILVELDSEDDAS